VLFWKRVDFDGFAGILAYCSTWNNLFCCGGVMLEVGLGRFEVGLGEFFDVLGGSISLIS
jgi:hypothetical protein